MVNKRDDRNSCITQTPSFLKWPNNCSKGTFRHRIYFTWNTNGVMVLLDSHLTTVLSLIAVLVFWSVAAHANKLRGNPSPKNLMDRPYKNLPIPSQDGPIDFDPENLPVWMRPNVGDDLDQGGDIVGRQSPNRYRKKLKPLEPIESPGQKAVYGGNFMGDGTKPVLWTPPIPNGGNSDALGHMLHAPEPHKIMPGGGVNAPNSKLGAETSMYLTPPQIKSALAKENSPYSKGQIGLYEGPPIAASPAMGAPNMVWPNGGKDLLTGYRSQPFSKTSPR